MGVLECVPQEGKVRFFFSVLVGAALGLVLSFIINLMLVDISLNPVFAFYFGICFACVGVVVMLRVSWQQDLRRQVGLLVFATMILVASILCFVFNSNWIFTLSPLAKIPLYGVISVALTFAVTFSIVDTLNFCLFECQPDAPAAIESSEQVKLILMCSIVMGFGYGMFFGLFDVGKTAKTGTELRHQLLHEELFCIPFGLTIGAFTAAANEIIRARQIKNSEYKYSPVFNSDDVDDMI